NPFADVFIHDRVRQTTVVVSVDSDQRQGRGVNWSGQISANGRIASFSSEAPELVPDDTNQSIDVFIHDTLTKKTSRVSLNHQGLQSGGAGGAVAIIRSGRFVSFATREGDLVPDDSNGYQDIFVHDRATLETTRVSIGHVGLEGDGDSYFYSELSPDGRWVVFSSRASNLTPGSSTNMDIYLRDRIELRCIGDPKPGGELGFRVRHALGEWGNDILILLSKTGTDRLELRDGRIVYLSFDSLTEVSLRLGLRGFIDEDGTSQTQLIPVPEIPLPQTFWAVALTLDRSTREIISFTSPISITFQ
ncbi:MAG: hypothetical protein RL885_30990, partial [Planctomycetota bacterium]